MTVAATTTRDDSARRAQQAQRAQQARQAQQLQHKELEAQPDDTAAPEAPVERQRATAEQQRASRQLAVQAEQQVKGRLPAEQSTPPVKAGLAGAAQDSSATKAVEKAADVASKPKTLDPNKPVLVLAPQFGDAEGDSIVKASYERLKAEAEAQGYQVIDAPNLQGEELRKKVAESLPEGYQGQVVAWTGGHGSVVDDQTKGRNEHEISRSYASGKSEQVRTAEDVLKPIYEAARSKAPDGHDPKMVAMVGSCNSGEAAQDLAETFSKDDQKNIAVVASSTKDQLSHGERTSDFSEAATVGFMRMLSQGSEERKAADKDKDGDVSAKEFVDHYNQTGGGLAQPSPHDDDKDGSIDRISLDKQTLVLGGNTDLSLVPKGEGKAAPSKDLAPGPMTLDEAKEDAKGLETYMEKVWGKDVKVDSVPNEKSHDAVDVRYEEDGSVTYGAGTKQEMNRKTTVAEDGSKTVVERHKDGTSYTSQIAKDGLSGTTTARDKDGKVLGTSKDRYNADGSLIHKEFQGLAPGMKGQMSIDPATKIRTDTNVQGPYTIVNKDHQDETDPVEHEMSVRDDQGKLLERKQVNRFPDHDDAKPFTRVDHQRVIPGPDGKSFTATYKQSSTGKVTGEWDDGTPMTNGELEQFFPEYYAPPKPGRS